MQETIESPTFTHKQLAVTCFNKVWEYLDLEDRTEEQSEAMVHLSHSSFWHWTQVEGHTPRNLSVGYWQLARVYAVIGQGEIALNYSNKCIEISIDSKLEPFYQAYGYESAARAYKVLKEQEMCMKALKTAHDFTSQVVEAQSKELLLKDLETI